MTKQAEIVKTADCKDKQGSRKVKYYPVICGNTQGNHKPMEKWLKDASEAPTCGESDIILAFCPVVSRLGTDIEAALQKIQGQEDSKPVILVVMHHTHDADATVPSSSRFVKDKNVLVVDCLFHEDRGPLRCDANEKAQNLINQRLCELRQVSPRIEEGIEESTEAMSKKSKNKVSPKTEEGIEESTEERTKWSCCFLSCIVPQEDNKNADDHQRNGRNRKNKRKDTI
ncbi:uncharacterized protein LOC114803224 [Denticeps clupeoides]|uniref:uncharacterized protein LOC114803224 n=1 Tax=Denticeps clupeoides TaxID=299321 RepID=UPI0010A3A816|nr:uncharacterized protein LOC114803224 [Denticeps clupeoides]